MIQERKKERSIKPNIISQNKQQTQLRNTAVVGRFCHTASGTTGDPEKYALFYCLIHKIRTFAGKDRV
jgi:hypothetical protein